MDLTYPARLWWNEDAVVCLLVEDDLLPAVAVHVADVEFSEGFPVEPIRFGGKRQGPARSVTRAIGTQQPNLDVGHEAVPDEAADQDFLCSVAVHVVDNEGGECVAVFSSVVDSEVDRLVPDRRPVRPDAHEVPVHLDEDAPGAAAEVDGPDPSEQASIPVGDPSRRQRHWPSRLGGEVAPIGGDALAVHRRRSVAAPDRQCDLAASGAREAREQRSEQWRRVLGRVAR